MFKQYLVKAVLYLDAAMPLFIVGVGVGIWAMFVSFKENIEVFEKLNTGDWGAIVVGVIIVGLVWWQIPRAFIGLLPKKPTVGRQFYYVSQDEFNKMSNPEIDAIMRDGKVIIVRENES